MVASVQSAYRLVQIEALALQVAVLTRGLCGEPCCAPGHGSERLGVLAFAGAEIARQKATLASMPGCVVVSVFPLFKAAYPPFWFCFCVGLFTSQHTYPPGIDT